MAARFVVPVGGDAAEFLHTTLSPNAVPFTPHASDSMDPGVHFARCSSKLRSLRGDSVNLKEELNLLFDQFISENYYQTISPSINFRPEDVCILLRHACALVPQSNEHLVIKFCQLVHHLLNQLKVIVDEPTLHALVSYIVRALSVCSKWTHAEVLLALSTVLYGNGPQCQKHLHGLLGEQGLLLLYSAPSQPDLELRRVALSCMTNICLGIPGQLSLEDKYRNQCYSIFLKALQAPKPDSCDELLYSAVIQGALKGLHCCLSGVKWRFGGGEEVGALLATLKRLMFQGTPGLSVEWPSVLYAAPLPQYEGPSTPKPPEPPKEAATPGKASTNKKKKTRGKGKKAEVNRGDDGDDEERETMVPGLPKGGGGGGGAAGGGESSTKPPTTSLYPAWKRTSSDSEFSDLEGSAQCKLRMYHGRVRQSALHCLLAVVRGVDKRMLYGYWSSFIPDAPMAGPPPLTLLSIVLKDPSPKVRACALQVLSAMLDGSRQFLGVAEDTATPRPSFTPFSLSLAATVRELHRCLTLALLAETSAQTLTQVIKCLAYLVSNAPYQRLRPGLLSPLWRHLRPYVRHRDVNVRVSALTLYGAMVTAQAPLPEVQLLLRQPEGSGGGGSGGGTPQDAALGWRHRDGLSSPSKTPGSRGRSPRLRTPAEQEGAEPGSPWLLELCIQLVTETRDEQSDGEAGGTGAAVASEPSPVRLEALQVLAHLVRGYFCLAQVCMSELGQVSARCLQESDPSVQLHGTKLLDELGTGIIQQNRPESTVPLPARLPMSQVVEFWTEVLRGPLNGALQSEHHPTLQTSACDALSSILPLAFAQLEDKIQMMCITVLLGLTYSENSLVKAAAVRALGVYILFPSLREDVMFVADTANTILMALEDKSPNVRAKAAWSLGNLTDTLIVNMESVGTDFQEELSDMLLLKMLQSATRASADKDRVKCNSVRALGNLLHFLRYGQLTRSVFQRPLEEAVRVLVQTVQSEATMKVRWNACYALGNAFRNPSLPLDSAPWSSDAFSALCSVVTSCKNFKVRIKSAAALSVPARRGCYGDVERFICVWHSLATALENSEETHDFLEYRYCASLRETLLQALVHLLSLSQWEDMPALGAALAGDEGGAIRGHLLRYLRGEGGDRGTAGEGESGTESLSVLQRTEALQQTLAGLRELQLEGEDERVRRERESGRERVVDYLEDLLKSSAELELALSASAGPSL
ncbi:HEAT repeat-containing protein 6 [Gadus macrocephalus]|uniref:HEAT repeat-containing protein 6 n=1 Tax=Gadus macrocephalus TaxID=80720 RepID=UPI0028CBBB2D|nr:HEAT repeat-containing protein 6 [Gadus macrocephalus]